MEERISKLAEQLLGRLEAIASIKSDSKEESQKVIIDVTGVNGMIKGLQQISEIVRSSK